MAGLFSLGAESVGAESVGAKPRAEVQSPKPSPAQDASSTTPGVENPEEAEEVEGPPTWRFRKKDRPVKVVVLAGSIGARPRGAYSHHLESMCSRVEIRNLSKTGLGSVALAQRFEERVIRNPYAKLSVPDWEYWLIFGGGLNSVGKPERSIHSMRKLFVRAHKKGFLVLGLSLTPWGSDADQRRWAGVAGLRYFDYTQKIVDFTMGRLRPQEALGSYAKKRKKLPPDAFTAAELPDLALDLFDSPLRHHAAKKRRAKGLRAKLSRNYYWRSQHGKLEEEAKQRQLESDAAKVAAIPQWYLRPDYHSFDAIHPNAQGHRHIAELICRSLPESWGCDCKNSIPLKGTAKKRRAKGQKTAP